MAKFESVVLERVGNLVSFVADEIKDIENDFFRGAVFILAWLVVITLAGSFIWSFFVNWKIGVSILGILAAVELITHVGRQLK